MGDTELEAGMRCYEDISRRAAFVAEYPSS
jgi:hypothetical protein